MIILLLLCLSPSAPWQCSGGWIPCQADETAEGDVHPSSLLPAALHIQQHSAIPQSMCACQSVGVIILHPTELETGRCDCFRRVSALPSMYIGCKKYIIVYNGFLKLFRQHELERLLSLINEAALCTVDDKKSELGYPVWAANREWLICAHTNSPMHYIHVYTGCKIRGVGQVNLWPWKILHHWSSVKFGHYRTDKCCVLDS